MAEPTSDAQSNPSPYTQPPPAQTKENLEAADLQALSSQLTTEGKRHLRHITEKSLQKEIEDGKRRAVKDASSQTDEPRLEGH
jgi:hypothetical protein